MNRATLLFLLAAIGMMGLGGCTTTASIAGTESGSQTTNGLVTGQIQDTLGRPLANVQVCMVPADYNPVTDRPIPAAHIDTTDDEGRYQITMAVSGMFNIQQTSLTDSTCHLVTHLTVTAGDTLPDRIDTVYAPGTIVTMLPDFINPASGYIYIEGTTLYSSTRLPDSTLMLPLLPALEPLRVMCAENSGDAPRIQLADKVILMPHEVRLLLFVLWSHADTIGLNTTASGAWIDEPVFNFPLLVRLNRTNFDFSQARLQGEDLRFATVDGRALPFEIERWDSMTARAEVWVTLDTIHPNSNSQAFVMHWGNPYCRAAVNAMSVFDTSAGFAGVWHLSGSGQARDATAHGIHADAYGSAVLAAQDGLIGTCRMLDGDTAWLQMSGSASGPLNFEANGFYTISTWIKLDTIGPKYYVAVAKGHEQYFLKLMGPQKIWEFTEWHDGVGDHRSLARPVVTGAWTHVVGIRDGERQYLYIDGELAVDTISIARFNIPRDTSFDVTIGRYIKYVANATDEGFCFFRGMVDEVRIDRVARSAAWIRLSYLNQHENDALLVR